MQTTTTTTHTPTPSTTMEICTTSDKPIMTGSSSTHFDEPTCFLPSLAGQIPTMPKHVFLNTLPGNLAPFPQITRNKLHGKTHAEYFGQESLLNNFIASHCKKPSKSDPPEESVDETEKPTPDINAGPIVDDDTSRDLGTMTTKHQCQHCLRVFSNSSNLKTHLRLHTGTKPYKCRFCEKTSATASNIQTHERIHTGVRPFKCDVCGSEYATSSNLKTHRRTHFGTRPFACRLCGKGFCTSSNLITHLRAHWGLRLYPCPTCGRLFSTSSNLRVHVRITHLGLKPFTCAICGKDFSTGSNLIAHCRSHTNQHVAAAAAAVAAAAAAATTAAAAATTTTTTSEQHRISGGADGVTTGIGCAGNDLDFDMTALLTNSTTSSPGTPATVAVSTAAVSGSPAPFLLSPSAPRNSFPVQHCFAADPNMLLSLIPTSSVTTIKSEAQAYQQFQHQQQPQQQQHQQQPHPPIMGGRSEVVSTVTAYLTAVPSLTAAAAAAAASTVPSYPPSERKSAPVTLYRPDMDPMLKPTLVPSTTTTSAVNTTAWDYPKSLVSDPTSFACFPQRVSGPIFSSVGTTGVGEQERQDHLFAPSKVSPRLTLGFPEDSLLFRDADGGFVMKSENPTSNSNSDGGVGTGL